MNAEISYLDNVDGSCLYNTPHTRVVASATGPVEPKARQELPTQLALELSVRPAAGVATTREVRIQDSVRAVITSILAAYKYPRQLCQLTLQVLQAGESEELFHCLELAACVNSAVFALVDAGVALTALALATTVALAHDGTATAEPSRQQLMDARSVHTVVFRIVDGKPQDILSMDSHGDFSEADILKVLDVAETSAKKLNAQFRETVLARVNIV